MYPPQSTLDRYLQLHLSKAPRDENKVDSLRRKLLAVDDMEKVLRLIVNNEKKVDECVGMVDEPHIKALRASARAAEKVLEKINNLSPLS